MIIKEVKSHKEDDSHEEDNMNTDQYQIKIIVIIYIFGSGWVRMINNQKKRQKRKEKKKIINKKYMIFEESIIS